MKTFRIDDVSINTNPVRLSEMVGILRSTYAGCSIVMAVSPCVFKSNDERVFPSILHREPDFRMFYKSNALGIPYEMTTMADIVAAHGMAHVDHRLLDKAAQEMSIVMSCSLAGSKIFVPPFHKYDSDTIAVCEEFGIELARLHDGMSHLKFNRVGDCDYYYFHTHDFATVEDFENQLKA